MVKTFPPNTWRNDNVVITSKRHFYVITSKWRPSDVITTSLLRNVPTGVTPLKRFCNVIPKVGFARQWFQCAFAITVTVELSVTFKTPLHGVLKKTLQWRHNDHDEKKTPKLRVTGLSVGNSPVTGEFPAQRASNAENVSIWWRHHEIIPKCCITAPLWGEFNGDRWSLL